MVPGAGRLLHELVERVGASCARGSIGRRGIDAGAVGRAHAEARQVKRCELLCLDEDADLGRRGPLHAILEWLLVHERVQARACALVDASERVGTDGQRLHEQRERGQVGLGHDAQRVKHARRLAPGLLEQSRGVSRRVRDADDLARADAPAPPVA